MIRTKSFSIGIRDPRYELNLFKSGFVTYESIRIHVFTNLLYDSRILRNFSFEKREREGGESDRLGYVQTLNSFLIWKDRKGKAERERKKVRERGVRSGLFRLGQVRFVLCVYHTKNLGQHP
jgi:hypothetical protein